MRSRDKRSSNRHTRTPTIKDYLNQDASTTITDDIQEQLRSALQQLEQHRLTSDLQVQKRVLMEQQMKAIQAQNSQCKQQIDELNKELSHINKKYLRLKEKKQCQRCKNGESFEAQLQKERQVYLNDRRMMQDQIKSLREQLQSADAVQERDQLALLTDSLKKELYLAGKRLEQQARIIHLLNEKISMFEVQNMRIMGSVQQLEGKLSEIEIDKVIHRRQEKACPNCSTQKTHKTKGDEVSSGGRRRKNGVINNMKKTERDDLDQLQRYQH